LSAPLRRALTARRYTEPTAIQLAAIPVVLRGQDLCASAPTGSGKTAAFALPILEILARQPRERANAVGVLVLAPTRELALQIGDFFTAYARCAERMPKIVTVCGGMSLNPQMMALRGGADIVVATPGRLLDLVDRNALTLQALATLVIDEADKLFELGFAEELSRVLGHLPPRRQTLLFSATFPPPVQSLAIAILRDPVRLEIDSSPRSVPAITQRAMAVDAARRTQLLRYLIQHYGWPRVLVFVATKYATEHVAQKLRRAGVRAAPFHGELSQGARMATLADFHASRLQVIVATDLAARGIDIVQLPAVVNFDLPRSAVDYVHRIGRTGRAGEHGVAVSLITAESDAHFKLIEKRQRISLPRERIAGFEPHAASVAAPPGAGAGGVKGRRKSKKDKLRAAAAVSPAGVAEGPAAPVAESVWARRKVKPELGNA
jgi:superfamily II DNA/RNA helicase